jgi:D-alanyl-D-alanine carboxypeptidase
MSDRHRRSTTLAALVVVSAALSGVLAYQSLGASPSSAISPLAAAAPSHPPPEGLPGGRQGAIGEADGVVRDSVTVFDNQLPAVAKLDPALLRALRRAATDAALDGIKIYVDSGWRSAKYQEELLRQAISKYGSAKEAARWVASPRTSAHVSGDAVDIGPSHSAAWLSKRGGKYGVCQIYRNEPWHYELRPDAVDRGCPRMYADPTHDPRMA